VLPSSLCAGKIAELIADKLNDISRDKKERGGHGYNGRFDRFVALPHTEGCGVEYAHNGIDVYTRTMVGHILHPSVVACVMLEHGCEKTHNDFFRLELDKHQPDGDTFPLLWASVQLDGGIKSVTEKVVKWIYDTTDTVERMDIKTDTSTPASVPSPLSWVEPTPTSLHLHNLCIGLVGSRVALQNSSGCLPPGTFGAIFPCFDAAFLFVFGTCSSHPLFLPAIIAVLASLSALVIKHGGSVIVPSNHPLLQKRNGENSIQYLSQLATHCYGKMFPPK
jgi:hypothetical protein